MAKAVVVGAGIGGLTAGVALVQAGWDVKVLERAERLEPVGAGISLWPNALRALDFVGLGDAVRERAALGAGTGVRTPDGRWLARSDLAPAVEERFGDPLVVLPRADLVDLLAGALPEGSLQLGRGVDSVHPRPAHAGVSVTDGPDLPADLVVAADGLSSRTRAHLFPAHPGPVYAGFTTWRFLSTTTAGLRPDGSETWGRDGERFAIVPMGDEAVYCFATATVPAGTTFPDDLEELRRRFGSWHEPIPALLDALSPAQVLRHDVFELAEPLPSFVLGRVALLGDAAHAMQPELGQGGCQALEDAVTLAALARPDGDVPDALTRYSGLRLPRTTRVSARVRAAGHLAQRGGLPRSLGARALGHLPPSLVARALAPIIDWRPPPQPR